MQIGRARLPAAAAKQNILQMIEKHQVLVISGETGCGKSTQVPQFVLDACLQSGRGSTTSILCTQPRRISALGLAGTVEIPNICSQNLVFNVLCFELFRACCQ
jgi:ATP-dependent RNA helicase DHX57